MWVSTQTGQLVNLDRAGQIRVVDSDIKPCGEPDMPLFLARYKTPKQAQAAMDRLEKWIATSGTSENFMAETHNPQVFSFRTLSEDDEF